MIKRFKKDQLYIGVFSSFNRGKSWTMFRGKPYCRSEYIEGTIKEFNSILDLPNSVATWRSQQRVIIEDAKTILDRGEMIIEVRK